MMQCRLILAALVWLLPIWSTPSAEVPVALAHNGTRAELYIACRDSARVLILDANTWEQRSSITVPANPSGLALAPDNQTLAVTCASPESTVTLVDLRSGRNLRTLTTGHTTMGPVFSPDGRLLVVCNRFNDDVSVYDSRQGELLRRIPVRREPVAAAFLPDSRHLLVANHLPTGPANVTNISAVISVLDLQSGRTNAELSLPSGSGSLQDIQVSPDGRHAIISHILGRYKFPTTQLDRGWMNTNAKTIIDLPSLSVLTTVLLDEIDRGAANPWGLGWSADSRQAAVALAGTHQVMVIDFPGLLARFASLPQERPKPGAYNAAGTLAKSDVPNDLGFLVGLTRRIALPEGDLGPRALAVVGTNVVTANYFSDTLSVMPLVPNGVAPRTVQLGSRRQLTKAELGELYFNDARICFQGWQTCASCHPGDGRVDALNWDLLNDGIGNPKNNRSLLLAHKTPPVMSTGVRDTAEVAVRSGVRHILFTVQPESVSEALDEYIKSLRPVPSPLLEKGKLSAAAQRGEKLFNSSRTGCSDCHPPSLYADLQLHPVGTSPPRTPIDTPTLVEIWRTAPYLHDGSAATLREVLTTANRKDQHGTTSQLSEAELKDLEAYLNSL